MIRLSHPRFTRGDWERLWPILESGMLIQGEVVQAFEQACAARLGVAGMAAVSSGTAALHLALAALDLGPGSEVVVPAFTWPSAANVAEHMGLSVRLVDISADSLNLDPALLGGALNDRTGAVVPVHLFGLAIDHRTILDRVPSERIVEDAACAFGARDRHGMAAGTWGRFGCFSLHARKGLTTGEGGLVTALRHEDLERIRASRNHGLARIEGKQCFVMPGLNYRLTELAGALGLGQLERFGQSLASRRRVAATYLHLLPGIPHIGLSAGLNDPEHVFQSFVISVDETVDRDALLVGLSERGVQAQVGTHAIHLQPYYAHKYGWAPDAYPVARWAHEKLVSLPMHEQMSESDARRVVEAVDEFLSKR